MRRIDEVMRKVIGSAIATELEDPRIGFVTVTAVETSPDLRSARVYVSVLGDEDEREATLAALPPRTACCRRRSRARCGSSTRRRCSFSYDESLERGDPPQPAARGRGPRRTEGRASAGDA